MMLCFFHLTYPYLVLLPALPCETGNYEITSFYLNTVRCFANEHTKHI